MNSLKEYIQERIDKIEKLKIHGKDLHNRDFLSLDFAIDQLQAVLDEIEEIENNK